MKKITITYPDSNLRFEDIVEDSASWISARKADKSWGAEGTYTITITDATDEIATKLRIAQQIQDGKNSRLCCEEIMDLVGGYNLSKAFTTEQITAMISSFAGINTYLKAYMPRSAKPLIAALTVSEVVTQQLKDDIAAIFAKYSI